MARRTMAAVASSAARPTATGTAGGAGRSCDPVAVAGAEGWAPIGVDANGAATSRPAGGEASAVGRSPPAGTPGPSPPEGWRVPGAVVVVGAEVLVETVVAVVVGRVVGAGVTGGGRSAGPEPPAPPRDGTGDSD